VYFSKYHTLTTVYRQSTGRFFQQLLDHADIISDNGLEVQRVSSDLVALTSLTGQIIRDLVSTLVNISANVSNMRRDSFLLHCNPALPQKVAVNLRASNYLGPNLFEPGLITSAQNRVNKKVAQSGQDKLVKSVVSLVKQGSNKSVSNSTLPIGGKRSKSAPRNHHS
jgi:hypothetical protein